MYFFIAVVDCPMLTAPLNGSFSPHVFEYGTMVTYSCSHGFTRVGAETTVCMPNGQWSNPMPTCERKYLTTIYNVEIMK